jgi:hypothetical protein
MAAPKTSAAALDQWLAAARAAACTRLELLTPRGAVLASLPIAGELPPTGASVLEHAADDAAGEHGRRTYRVRIYDTSGFREERRVVVEGGAATEDEADEAGGGLGGRALGERAALGHVAGLLESTVREMRCMFKVGADSLAGAREAENAAREKWGELLTVMLSMAQLTVERETARGELDRKVKRDAAIADQLGPSARALIGYLTRGKGVDVNDAVRKLFRSLMSDEGRATQVMALLSKAEQTDLLAIGAYLDGEKNAPPADTSNGVATTEGS